MRHGAIGAMLASTAAAADPVALSDFIALPRSPPTHEIRYGDAENQAIDVSLPPSDGPHPVVVFIHGGCWSATTADRRQLRHLATDLARGGVAVWSIGYRRADERGGGYPGTYLDVGAALDRLRDEAPRFHLDLERTVLVGHSAGGHLALWAAARGKLAAGSSLGTSAPLVPSAVISLAGIGDLKEFGRFVPILCGPGIIERLMPPGTERETSPAAMPAPDVPVSMISGVLDRLVPPYVAHDYAVAMRGRAAVELIDIPGAGHFDLVTATAPAWKDIRRRVRTSLGMETER
jgi:acetyl esterase/lipase